MRDAARGEAHKLNLAILNYLQWHFPSTAKTFANEAHIQNYLSTQDADRDVLLTRWSTTSRLQIKLSKLEKELADCKANLSLFEKASIYASEAGGLPSGPAAAVIVGHRKAVTRLVFHPLFQLLFSASEDATIKIWDYDKQDGCLERTLKAHTEGVTDLAFNRTGTKLASSSQDATVKLWNCPNYDRVKTLHGHHAAVSSVVFSDDGEFLFSASRDRSVKQWAVETGVVLRTHADHTDWVRSVAIPEVGFFSVVASAGNDRSINISRQQAASHHLVKQLTDCHTHVIECIRFAPLSLLRHLLDHREAPPPASPALTQSLLIPGDERRSMRTDGLSWHTTVGVRRGDVREVLEKAGLVLLSASRDNTMKMWDVFGGALMRTFVGHDNWIRNIVVHSTGKHIISCSDDRTIRSWDVLTGVCCEVICNAHSGFVTSLAMSSQGCLVASGSLDCNINIWTCRKREEKSLQPTE
eukprot:GHVS01090020.1.p1 GENE.GHVS01090020.1~~GHVS01090020.1.p1  ORF type:complete len:503 (-),score=55.62 GHVS01090020.1:34-1440(-)